MFIFVAAITAHLLYSSFGFNPTDDGFTLAYGRRLIEGEIPHRDFIIIRPALSPLLHVPEILFGGSCTFWLSRFVFFFQCAFIAWFSTAFINRNLSLALSSVELCAISAVSFAFCCHSFPAMAWHTIDGLFLLVLGFYLRTRITPNYSSIAYLLLGLAYLCKQGFFLMIPVSLVLFGDWKNWKCLLASAVPGIFYIVFMALSGGLSDCVQQLISQKVIVETGIYSYLNVYFFCGLAVGIVATSLLYSKTSAESQQRVPVQNFLGLTLYGTAFILAALSLSINRLPYISFALLGIIIGTVIYIVLKAGQNRKFHLQTGVIVALLGWSTSLSIGYNSPVLISGIILIFLFGISFDILRNIGSRWRLIISIVAAIISIAAFHRTRTHHVYRDLPASELTLPIGDVLPGGQNIRTNPNTYAFLYDLNSAIDSVVKKGYKYAILPSVAGHWVKSQQRNPLPIDWAQHIELSSPELLQREIRSIEVLRSGQMVIVQKVLAENLASGSILYDDTNNQNAIVTYVRTHLDKAVETKYFYIYR